VAAERLANEDPADRARLTTLRANLCWERGDIATAVDAARRAIELAEAHGEPEDIAAAHEALAIVDHFRGDWREGLVEEVDRLGKLPDQQAQLAGVFDIHHCIGQYHLYGDGLWQSVEGYARRTLELAERAGAVRAQAFAWCLLGESLLLRARWDEAAGCLQTSGELHASLGTRSGGLPWQRLGEVAVCRGDPNDAGPFLTKAAGIATVSPMAPHLWGRIHATAALTALETGDHASAVRSIRAASGTAARYGECLSCSALLHPVAAEVYAALDDVEAIRPHLAAADRIAGLSSSSAWRAMASSARASLQEADGRRVDAAHTYLLASDLFEQAGQPYWAARAAGHSRRVA
jgi:tetratricopeptide (TPR) repeat protein